MTILFCFAACSNSSSPVNTAPKIIGAYTLNGDIICLYDDNTFVIMKDNVVTVSGTYTRDENDLTLTVGQANDDKATSGANLVLKVEGNGNINVSQSDIAGYEEGDKGEQTVTPSQSNNPGSDDSSSDIRHSLRDDVSEELKIPQTDSSRKENFSAVQNAEGIQIKFAMPKETNAYEVYIEGIGLVTENYFGVGNMTEDDFFYPFLTSNKEYAIRVVFLKAEVEKDGWNYGHLDGDGIIGWFDVTATSGANSKGEVRLNDFVKIEVEKNGDFKFTKKLVFENESLIQGWILGIGLNEGVSWLHDDRRSKWLTEIDIPSNEILNKKYNFYTYFRPYGDVTKVDFIVYRPKLFYKYGDREYKYQWDGCTMDTNCKPEAELWADIDVNNDSAKIQGKWKYEGYGSIIYYREEYTFDANFTKILKIEAPNVYETDIDVVTKSDGTVFTEEEKQNCWRKFGENLWENDEPNYYIATISSDGKTVTTEQYEVYTLSEYFADRKYDDGYTKHYDLKLFNDSLLRIIQSGKDEDGEDYEWYSDYKKQ